MASAASSSVAHQEAALNKQLDLYMAGKVADASSAVADQNLDRELNKGGRVPTRKHHAPARSRRVDFANLRVSTKAWWLGEILWFKYPAAQPGSCGLLKNVPISSPIFEDVIRALEEVFPYFVAVHAVGQNTVDHCKHSYHRGPLLAAALVMLCQRDPAAAMPADEFLEVLKTFNSKWEISPVHLAESRPKKWEDGKLWDRRHQLASQKRAVRLPEAILALEWPPAESRADAKVDAQNAREGCYCESVRSHLENQRD